MIAEARSLGRDARVEGADVVVVGTGAGGGMAMHDLALRGLSVVALEEGERHLPATFDQREDSMIPRLFQEMGGRTTHDHAIRVLQGRGVGGSTVHNTNLCKRTPPEILDLWAREHGVAGAGERDLRAVFESVERDLSVSEIPEASRNANNRILERGVRALGVRGGALSHNRVGCQGSGFCELGCFYDAKQNSAKVLVPRAVEAGARLFVGARVTRVLHDGRRVLGVAADALDDNGRVVSRFTVPARAVVLSASATASAALAIASDLPDPFGRAGRGLRLHPGAAVAGFFDERVEGWKGIPQSYECTELLDFAKGSDRRVWITTVFAHPIGAATNLPGFGAAHSATMRRYAHMAILTAMVHDESEGRVTVAADGAPELRYEMREGDREQLAAGLRLGARLLLAAGAREVIVPGTPLVRVTSDRGADAIVADLARPHAMPISSVHPLGTMSLGDDPRRSVVKSTGEHHAVRGLFVLDGSLFPTSIGVPPQISIYAFARHLAPHVADAASRGD